MGTAQFLNPGHATSNPPSLYSPASSPVATPKTLPHDTIPHVLHEVFIHMDDTLLGNHHATTTSSSVSATKPTTTGVMSSQVSVDIKFSGTPMATFSRTTSMDLLPLANFDLTQTEELPVEDEEDTIDAIHRKRKLLQNSCVDLIKSEPLAKQRRVFSDADAMLNLPDILLHDDADVFLPSGNHDGTNPQHSFKADTQFLGTVGPVVKFEHAEDADIKYPSMDAVMGLDDLLMMEETTGNGATTGEDQAAANGRFGVADEHARLDVTEDIHHPMAARTTTTTTNNNNTQPTNLPTSPPICHDARQHTPQSEDKSDPAGRRCKPWTKQEDQRLLEAVKKYGTLNFSTVASFVPGRNTTQCRARWARVLRPGLKKGYWSPEEDKQLVKLVAVYREDAKSDTRNEHHEILIDWNVLKDKIRGRSVKQCRERWTKNLDPFLKKGAWTAKEDEIVVREQERIGNKWAQIARMLPGRTEHNVKTRWRSLKRVKKRHWTATEDKLLISLRLDSETKQKSTASWTDIAAQFDNRTRNAVMTRYKVLMARERKKLAASAESVSDDMSSCLEDDEEEE